MTRIQVACGLRGGQPRQYPWSGPPRLRRLLQQGVRHYRRVLCLDPLDLAQQRRADGLPDLEGERHAFCRRTLKGRRGRARNELDRQHLAGKMRSASFTPSSALTWSAVSRQVVDCPSVERRNGSAVEILQLNEMDLVPPFAGAGDTSQPWLAQWRLDRRRTQSDSSFALARLRS